MKSLSACNDEICTSPACVQDATYPGACCMICCDARPKIVCICIQEDLKEYESAVPFKDPGDAKIRAMLENISTIHSATWGSDEVPDFPSSQHVEQFGLNDFLVKTKKQWLKGEQQEVAFKKFQSNHIPQFTDPLVRNALRAIKANLPELMGSFNDREAQCMVQ